MIVVKPKCWRRVFVAAMITCVSVFVAGQTLGENVSPMRWALVIGNSDYVTAGDSSWSYLGAPANDAKQMAKALEAKGFKLVGGKPQINVTSRQFDDLLKQLKQSVELTSGAVVFIYYSGHGIEIEDANFLVPVDAPNPLALRRDSTLSQSLIGFDQLYAAFVNSNTSNNIIILDSCRESQKNDGGKGALEEKARDMLPPRTFIGFATSFGSVVHGNDEHVSEYTKAWVEEIKNATPTDDIDTLQNRVAQRVVADTYNEQRPVFRTDDMISTSPFFVANLSAKESTVAEDASSTSDVKAVVALFIEYERVCMASAKLNASQGASSGISPECMDASKELTNDQKFKSMFGKIDKANAEDIDRVMTPLLAQAAEQGNADAMLFLGMHDLGSDSTKREQKFGLGNNFNLLKSGEGWGRNASTGWDYIFRAADLGSTTAMQVAGEFLLRHAEFDEDLKIPENWPPADISRAEKYLRTALDAGYGDAGLRLALFYESGTQVGTTTADLLKKTQQAADYEKARYYAKRAIAAGFKSEPKSEQIKIISAVGGECIMAFHGTYDAACGQELVGWVVQNANLNDEEQRTQATTFAVILSMMHTGEGEHLTHIATSRRDIPKVHYYLEFAARNGSMQAKKKLGDYYSKGYFGYPQDKQEADYWYSQTR